MQVQNIYTNWDDIPIIMDAPMAADILGIHQAVLRKMFLRTGKIKAFRVGHLWRIKKEDLREFIENGGENQQKG